MEGDFKGGRKPKKKKKKKLLGAMDVESLFCQKKNDFRWQFCIVSTLPAAHAQCSTHLPAHSWHTWDSGNGAGCWENVTSALVHRSYIIVISQRYTHRGQVQCRNVWPNTLLLLPPPSSAAAYARQGAMQWLEVAPKALCNSTHSS